MKEFDMESHSGTAAEVMAAKHEMETQILKALAREISTFCERTGFPASIVRGVDIEFVPIGTMDNPRTSLLSGVRVRLDP
jgi:hypothetical protein